MIEGTAGDDEPDTFRIKIWTETEGDETVVYDNGFDEVIEGGSIVIHDRWSTGQEREEEA